MPQGIVLHLNGKFWIDARKVVAIYSKQFEYKSDVIVNSEIVMENCEGHIFCEETVEQVLVMLRQIRAQTTYCARCKEEIINALQ